MRKKLRLFSFFLVFLALGFMIIGNAFKEEGNVEAAIDGYTVRLINGNEDAGVASIAIYDKSLDIYVDSGKKELTVNKNTKVKMYFPNGLNDGYEIYSWCSASNGYLKKVYTSQDQEEVYQKDYLVKTINASIDVYVYAKKKTDHVVSFFDSNVEAKRSLVGISITSDGGDAKLDDVFIPKRSGFDFLGWSLDLTNIQENIDVYPIYTSNIWTVFRDFYPMFFKGLGVTLLLSVVAVFCALFLGCLVCLLRLSNFKMIRFIATGYVEIIRGVPLLLQLLLVYVLLGPTKISLGSFFTTEVISCILTLFINSSAYTSEIFRSGIQAVDKGQMEAGRALGMTKWEVMLKVILPQGIKNSLPSIGNELIMIIKETSLAVSIDASIGELMSVRKNITGSTYINLPPYIIVAMIYFCVTFSLSKLVGLIEKRLSKID